jgi:hypothetical protein
MNLATVSDEKWESSDERMKRQCWKSIWCWNCSGQGHKCDACSSVIQDNDESSSKRKDQGQSSSNRENEEDAWSSSGSKSSHEAMTNAGIDEEEIFCLSVFIMDDVVCWDNYADLDEEQPGSLVDGDSKSDIDESIFQCYHYRDPGDDTY